MPTAWPRQGFGLSPSSTAWFTSTSGSKATVRRPAAVSGWQTGRTQASRPTGPGLDRPAMAFDPAINAMVLFGGYGAVYSGVIEVGIGVRCDTWTFEAVGSGCRTVASDDGIFSFGAPFFSSTGICPSTSPSWAWPGTSCRKHGPC